jgi:hypothetical protein
VTAAKMESAGKRGIYFVSIMLQNLVNITHAKQKYLSLHAPH